MDWPHKVRGCWCTHALGSLGNGVTSCYINMWICVKTRWKPQQRLYVKRCLAKTVPISSGRRGKMTDRHALEPIFFGHVKPKKHHFPFPKWSKQKTLCNWHKIKQKNTKNTIQVCRNLTLDTFSIIDVVHKWSRRHARFPVGRDVFDMCSSAVISSLTSWECLGFHMSCVLTAYHQLLTCSL